MERNIYYQSDQKIKEEKYDNIKNFLILLAIIMIANLIEKLFRNSFIKMFYLIIILFIILIIIILNSSQFKNLISNVFRKSNININEMNKKELKKVQNIYESGYMYNKMNNDKIYELNMINNKKVINNKYDNFKDDEILFNKISNINKINSDNNIANGNENYNYNWQKNIMINNDYNKDYFNNNTNKFNNINNINNFNNEKINSSKKFTNLPEKNSYINNSIYTNNDMNPFKIKNSINNKDIIASPFNKKTKLPPPSSSSSGNFFLLSNNNNNITNNKLSNNKFINNFEFTNPINKISNISNVPNISDFGNNISEIKNIPKDKEVSFNKYQNLKNRYENYQALSQNYNKLNYDINKIPRELININYKNWVIKMKNFISRTLIPNIIKKHDDNILNLNSILKSLGVEISSTLCNNDDNYLKYFNEKIYFLNSNKINIESNMNENKLNDLLYKKTKNFFNNQIMNEEDNGINNNSIFPSLMNFSNYLDDTKDYENKKYIYENQLNKIFFGDTNKIKQILSIVENKINALRINKIEESQIIIQKINLNSNPFLTNDYMKNIDNYLNNVKDINNPTLINLRKLLYERIILNDRLYPKELFTSKDPIHALLVIEYTIERLHQLQQNFELYGNGSGGGDFLNENWCSLLPTDSQIISHIIINYIESIYEINNNRNQQIFLLSYPSNASIFTNNDINNSPMKTSVFLYQINPPNVEPKFNVVLNGDLIPCSLKDINLYHAFSIYFYLLSIKSPIFVKNLGIHRFINELIK